MKVPTYLLLLSVALLVFLGACGSDGIDNPITVDTVPPNPPVGLGFEHQEESVLITWSENAEVDLAGYRLYRSYYQDGPFGEITTGLLLCPWYYDGDVVPTVISYYMVTAVDGAGNESAYSDILTVCQTWNPKPGPNKRLD